MTYKDYSMDARLIGVIALGLEDGEYLEVFLEEGEPVHATKQSNWSSTLSLGLVSWGEPYLLVRGEKSNANETFLEDLRAFLVYRKIGYPVEDMLY